MLIIGSGGLAKDIVTSLEVDAQGYANDLMLFDNTENASDLLFEHYPIIHSFDELSEYFKDNTKKKEFIVCIGNPLMRFRLAQKVIQLGGIYTPYVSFKTCAISPITKFGNGVVIQHGCIISRDAVLGEGVFLNASVVLGHDVKIGNYVSVGPGVRILGGVEIGEYSYIGCNAVIMPGIKIGKKVRIGVGKVIESDVPDNAKIM